MILGVNCLDLFKLRWAIITGVLVGVVVSTAGTVWVPTILAAFDKLSPVVVMEGRLVEAKENYLVVHISGEKFRDCQYLNINAYGAEKDGNLRDLSIMRVDKIEDGTTKPKGKWDIGYWKVWPSDGITGVMVVVSHNCEGRLINTKIAEVVLANMQIAR